MSVDNQRKTGHDSPRKQVAIAGASGFVGRALREHLSEQFDLIALTRSPSRTTEDGRLDQEGVRWRQCDLFHPEAVCRALEGVDILIYLVHSMSPQSRLTQARFEDLDVLLADNVRKACEANGVKHIVYLGGLGTRDPNQRTSRHLSSRREVGLVLDAGPVSVTRIRAGVVIGHGGSSLRMLTRLIRKLPFMVLPRWTATPTQPVGLQDVVRAFETVLNDPASWTGDLDVGITERMTYGDMILRTARLMDRRPVTVRVPIASPKVSTLWIMLFSGEPRSLVFPLVSSLASPTVVEPNPLMEHLAEDMQSFDSAVSEALEADGGDMDPRRESRRRDRVIINHRRLVRSVQRMTRPAGWSTAAMARGYWGWLKRWGWRVLRVRLEAEAGEHPVQRVEIKLFGLITMLVLERDAQRCSEFSEVQTIVGGLLVRRRVSEKGMFEFRRIPGESDTVMIVLQDYAPSLPWYIYEYSQALIHLVVMAGFRRWLRRQVSPGAGSAAAPASADG